jgi:hypothetical protein
MTKRISTALLAAAVLAGCQRTEEPGDSQEPAPGTVPVPGAAAPGSAPDHFPGAGTAEDAYPGTVGPTPIPVDTVAEPRAPIR